jgi:hypothetical protein
MMLMMNGAFHTRDNDVCSSHDEFSKATKERKDFHKDDDDISLWLLLFVACFLRFVIVIGTSSSHHQNLFMWSTQNTCQWSYGRRTG